MESTATAASEAETPSVVFRPSKKRKFYRQRGEDTVPPPDTEPAASRPAPADEAAASEDEKGPSVAEVLRLRGLRKGKPRGVEFRPDDAARAAAPPVNLEQSLVLHDAAAAAEAEPPPGMSQRFAPQTGITGELINRHM